MAGDTVGWGRLFRSLFRVHVGFSVVRVNSLRIKYPKRTSVDLLGIALSKLKRGI